MKGKNSPDKISIIIMVSVILNITCFADVKAYDEIVNLEVEDSKIRVFHYHNWSKATNKERYKMITTHQNPFTPENNYAYLECIEKKTCKRLFKTPSTALTKLYIAEDSRYIIGLSKIMLRNPYQLLIFDTEGNLIYKKHIAASEAKLNLTEYQEFRRKYPDAHKVLKSLERITIRPDGVYVDFLSANMPIILGRAWDYLIKRRVPSNLSKNFSESISNWVFWYKEPDPEIELKYQNDKLAAISLLDPKGERFEIPIAACDKSRPNAIVH